MEKVELLLLVKDKDSDMILFDEKHKKVLARASNTLDILRQLGKWGRFEFSIRESYLSDFFCQMNA